MKTLERPKKRLRVDSPTDIATQIIGINGEILAYEEPLKQLKARKDELRQLMLDSLKANRMSALETDSGVTFTRAFRSSLTISDLPQALKWAVANGVAKVDTIRAGKILKGSGAIPEGLEYKETEYLSTTGIKGALEE